MNLSFAKAFLISSFEKSPKVIAKCDLGAKIKTVLSVAYGKLNNQDAFYIDEVVDESFLQTEILSFDKVNISNLTSALLKPKIQDNLIRGNTLFCQDIDGDNIVEIPKIAGFVEKQAVASSISVLGIDWVNFNGTDFIHDFYSVVNLNERYLFTFPEKWLSSIVVKKDLTSNGIGFYLKNETVEKNELIFSLLAFNNEEWKTKKIVYGYSLFKEFSDRIFALKKESNQSFRALEYNVSNEELSKLFSQVTVKQR